MTGFVNGLKDDKPSPPHISVGRGRAQLREQIGLLRTLAMIRTTRQCPPAVPTAATPYGDRTRAETLAPSLPDLVLVENQTDARTGTRGWRLLPAEGALAMRKLDATWENRRRNSFRSHERTRCRSPSPIGQAGGGGKPLTLPPPPTETARTEPPLVMACGIGKTLSHRIAEAVAGIGGRVL